MKLTVILITAAILQVSAGGFAQNLTLKTKNATLKQVFSEIKKQTGLNVLYRSSDIKDAKLVNVNIDAKPIEEAMVQILKDQTLDFGITDRDIVIRPKEEKGLIEQIKDYFALIQVRGKVVDENGQPLGGASVVLKSTGKGISTAADGTFSMRDVEEGAVLLIKYIGFDIKEINAAKELGTIRLKPATNDLDQVQIQAYGTTSKRLTTSNISTVRAEDIEKQPVSNPLLALQGRVPGLVVTPASGFSGGTVKVRVQGYNSMNGGNNPFYVVDGVPFNAFLVQANTRLDELWGAPEQIRRARQQLSGESSGSPFSYINPSDIESIEILKDADATAIYGSKAANGAIIITTKKGKAGPMKIDATFRSGFDKIERTLDFLNYEDYRQMRLEARRNNNEGILATDYDLNGFWGTQETNRDYQKTLLSKSASNHNVQVSASGGTGTTNYRVNIGYQFQDGVLGKKINSGNENISLGLNLNTASANSKFKTSFSIIGSLNDNKLPYSNPIVDIMMLPPNSPPLYNEDGTINWALNATGFTTWNNPMVQFERSQRIKTNSLNSNILLSYELLPNLKLMTTAGYNMMDMENVSKYPITSVQPIERTPLFRQTNVGTSHSRNYIVEPQLTFQKQLNRYKLDFLLGGTIQRNTENGTSLSAYGFPSDAQMDNLPIATGRNIEGLVSRIYRYNAGFARFSFNRDDEFLLNLTVRRDGSSRFGPNNKFQNFAAVGAGWVFTERKWIKENLEVLNFGKVRVSYGLTGSDQVGDYTYMDLYGATTSNIPYQGISSITSRGIFNSNLQWEKNRKLNFGLDLSFFKDRISFSGNYAINRSDNLLQQRQYSSELRIGLSAPTAYINFPGLIENTSLELSLSTRNIKSGDFTWQTTFNITHSTNKLKSIGDERLLNGVLGQIPLGRSLLSRKLVKYLGADPLTGMQRMSDKNGNPTYAITYGEDDNEYIDLLPAYTGGVTNSFSYKGIGLDIFLQFQKQYLDNYQLGMYGNSAVNIPSFASSRWRNPGDIAVLYKSGLSLSSMSTTDALYEDASFIRVKNIAFSYNLPSKWIDRLKIRQVRLIAQVQNLWTITKYSGLDPETGASVLPMPRTIVFGLNLGL